MTHLPILTTLVTFAFGLAVFSRFLKRKHAHLLIWTIGLGFYGLGTLSESFLGFVYHNSEIRLWYLCGAMLSAAWLGQGTIHLLVRRRGVALGLTILLALVSVVAAVSIFTSPVTAAAHSYNIAQPASAQYGAILTRTGLTLALTIILNIYGTLALVGGAIYSAFLFWRKRVMINRVVGNVLIALGALMPALGGSFIKAGLGDWLYISELLGAVIMYIGFTQATVSPAPQSVEAPAHAT
jgi:hypothetical protein